MKKLFCIMIMLVMAAAIMLSLGGCASKHESEYDEHQKELEVALEEYQQTYETSSAKEKLEASGSSGESVMIYYPSDGNKGLERDLDGVEEITDESISQKLIDYGVIPQTAELIGFDPVNHVITYTGISDLTARQAIAVINTFTESFEFPEQWELKIDDDTVMVSGYCADWKNIDDTYEGGAEDFDSEISVGGPGVE